jgi:O-antigen/teichoic acid export membrane protein
MNHSPGNHQPSGRGDGPAGLPTAHPPQVAGPVAVVSVVEPNAGELARVWRWGSRTRVDRVVALTDQVLSGLSNFLTLMLVARSVQPEGFGRFAVVYTLFLGILGTARQMWGTRISLTRSAEEALWQARRLMGAAVWVTPFAICLITLPSLALTGWRTLPIILVLAAALPIVVAQDLCRYASIASGRPAVAAVSDLLWVAVVAGAYAFRPPIMFALAAWLGGAILSLAAALIGLRSWPALSHGWSALRQRHRTGEVSALGYVSASLATYVTLALATVALGPAAAGALRGASTVMAPVNTLFAFAGLSMLPVIFRAPHAHRLRPVGQVSLGLVVAATVWGGVLLLVPPGVGQLLLGESWGGARSVLPWTVLEYLSLALASGAVLGLQALREARGLGLVLISGTGFVVSSVAIAAAVGDSVVAFASALSGATFLYALLAWLTFLRGRRSEVAAEQAG